MQLRHVMIDLETMGTLPSAAIVSIGAVIFDPRVNKVSRKTFYTELEWTEQNRLVCENTQDWWEKQSSDTKDALYGLDDLKTELVRLAKFLPNDCKVWGNGCNFDITILEDAYRQHKLDIPWKFWNVRDCRTVKDMYESSRGGWDKKMGGTKHNALQDAIYQAQYINEMWKSLAANRGGS